MLSALITKAGVGVHCHCDNSLARFISWMDRVCCVKSGMFPSSILLSTRILGVSCCFFVWVFFFFSILQMVKISLDAAAANRRMSRGPDFP